MYEIEISNQEETVALIPIKQLVDNYTILIETYNYYNQTIAIDITPADENCVKLSKLEIIAANMLNVKFLVKKYSIKIKELVFRCSGLNYSGGAEVENLIIFSDREEVILGLNIAEKIDIKLVEKRDEREIIVRNLMPGFNVIVKRIELGDKVCYS